MPKKILIPLDGSKLGEAALDHVEELISTLSAEKKVEVTLLQILKPATRRVESGDSGSIDVSLTEEEMEPLKKEALDYLNQASEGLRRKGVAVKCVVIVSSMGVSSAEEIIKYEGAINADLVAMSTHGRRGLSRWVFGSITEKVLRAGKAPVLIVRARKKT